MLTSKMKLRSMDQRIVVRGKEGNEIKRRRVRPSVSSMALAPLQAGTNLPYSDNLYRTLVDTSPDAIILVSPEGTILLGNGRAANLHGFHNADELVGSNVFNLISHEEHQRAIEHLGGTVELGSIRNIEHTLLRLDGTAFPAELSLSVVLDAAHKPIAFIGIIRDISERKAVQAQVETLLEEVQRSNEELALAYDATLEGWSGALDLRDKETEGHSQRVTALTLRLARLMGVGEEDLLQVRRGALLHDIGKMGIPDAILLKPGPLTDEEWRVMRMHPVYAHNLLRPVPFLRAALPIPYSHHEKWDGSGYPLGLKGEEIPLAARIFAVADVWDALSSDRPYRKAWSPEKVLDHIVSQAGTHFDPQVITAFVDLYNQGELDHAALVEEMMREQSAA